jgi:hypothetical protein
VDFDQTLVSHCNKYKKTKEACLPTFVLFIDYENAYNNIQQILNGDKILSRLLLAINSLYRITTIKIDLEDGNILKPIHIAKLCDKALVLPIIFHIYIKKLLKEKSWNGIK